MDTYLFFGSFNPIHNGHVAMAEFILDSTCSELWFVVSPQNPHKDPSDLAAFEDRIEMVRRTVLGMEGRVKACDIENSLSRPSYTVNTIAELKRLHPERNFILLAGSDIADTIGTWYRYEELMSSVPVRFYPRKENDRDKCSPEFRNAPVLELSSTDFRKKRDLTLLPRPAAEYIVKCGLYRISEV